MKLTRLLIVASVVTLLSACGKHPSTLTGVWAKGEQGIFSTQIVLTLKSSGDATLTVSNALAAKTQTGKWEVANNALTLSGDSAPTTYRVVSVSKTDMVLQGADGSLDDYKRMGN